MPFSLFKNSFSAKICTLTPVAMNGWLRRTWALLLLWLPRPPPPFFLYPSTISLKDMISELVCFSKWIFFFLNCSKNVLFLSFLVASLEQRLKCLRGQPENTGFAMKKINNYRSPQRRVLSFVLSLMAIFSLYLFLFFFFFIEI